MNTRNDREEIMIVRLRAVMMIALMAVCALTVMGQVGTPTAVFARFDRIPSLLQRQLNVLGNRMRDSGKQQTIYAGEVTDAAGKRSPAQVIYQLPGLVSLVGFKAGQGTLSFDGERAFGVISRDDQAVLDVFVMDLPEGMLASVQSSAAVRLLGRGFGPDPRSAKKYIGPRYDIIEVTAPTRSAADRSLNSKLYYYDSQTGLLQSTRYYDRSRSSAVKLETRFSEWRAIDGSLYPGRIEHFEAGQLIFSFVANTITAAPGIDAASFR
jgi:hypothetical protein